MSTRLRSRAPISNVPKYTIDLSLPAHERYRKLTSEYYSKIQDITPLFNGLLADLGIEERFHLSINRLARFLLRGVYSRVETAELKGISETANISMYLLVAFNVVLDLLMGCTSGAVRSREAGEPGSDSRMLHFRTLDWGMDPLRSIIVQLDFVRSKSQAPTKIVASSVTYVGFVGVLTGVRERLSLSLNFRPLHNAATKRDHFKFYFHHLLVLLGVRPSISSILREYLYSESSNEEAKDLASIAEELAPKHTTAAYLTFSDGQRTLSMEKDYSTAVIRESTSFIAATNHDRDESVSMPNAPTPGADQAIAKAQMASLQELLDESRERADCIEKKWRSEVRQAQRRAKSSRSSESVNTIEQQVSISPAEVVRWVSDWPTTNETTHFAAVLDPLFGKVLWTHAYAEPHEEPDK